jgi:ribonuclease D
MIEYALNDVRYLLEMGEIIVAKLHEKGRYEWFIESCEAAKTKVGERDDTKDEQWRISGSGKLDSFALACLRALWQWRDKEAEAWDRPSFMVAPNRQLIEWSNLLAEGKKISLPNHFRGDRVKRFREMQAKLEALPKSEWPARTIIKRRKRDNEFDNRVDSLIEKRNKIGAELDVENSLIASRAALEALAANEAEPSEVLMNWQRKLLDL